MDLNKINEAAEKGGGAGFTDPYKRAPIRPGNNIVRLIGNEVKAVKRSWVLCDDNKRRPFNVEGTVLEDVMTLVLAHDRKKDERTGEPYNEYHHKDKRSFRIVAHNDSRDDSQRGWSPSNITMLHCIPRTLEGMKWCQDNNHAMLLTKTPSSIGVGKTVMEKLKEIAGENGDPENYDINFTKEGSGRFSTEYGGFRADPNLPGVKPGPLEEWEVKAREEGLYDLEIIGAPSPLEYIYRNLKKALEAIDGEMGTTFLKELVAKLPDPSEARNVLPDQGTAPTQTSSPATQTAAPATQSAAPKTRKIAPPPKQEAAPADDGEEKAACPNCQTLAPMEATECPNPDCKVKFV